MDRILRRTSATITLEIYDASGALVDATGLPTVTIEDSAGVAIATDRVTTRASVGVYDAALSPAETAVLDSYSAAWTATVGGAEQTFATWYETVGGFLFSIAELRGEDEALADTGAYPAAQIRRARNSAEDRLEQLCGLAFVPRGRRVSLDGNDEAGILLPDLSVTAVVAASVDGTALTGDELAALAVYGYGLVVRGDGGVWTAGQRNVEVFYEHGMAVAPEPVRRAARKLAASEILPSAVPDRAVAESTDVGTIRWSIAGRDGPTGIPEVDAVIDQFASRDLIGG